MTEKEKTKKAKEKYLALKKRYDDKRKNLQKHYSTEPADASGFTDDFGATIITE